MAKISVIYRATDGDTKVCEWGGYTFFDGKPTEVEDNAANAAMIAKMRKNRAFEVSEEGTANQSAPEGEDEVDEHGRGRKRR